jgi:Fe-S-cluster containining protein
VEAQLIPLAPDDSFSFSCSPDAACFNACCRDLNQFLTPYDILRLKDRLAMSSGQFLERYTVRHVGPESGLPVVSLKPEAGDARACPFVTSRGCRVYADRPSSCRTYPLVRAVSRSRETGRLSEHFMLLKEPHCRGFEQRISRTVRNWLEDQEVEVYNRINDRMMEVIRLKNIRHPSPLDIPAQHLFSLALYDLDTFRVQVFEKGLVDAISPDPSLMERAAEDDLALLSVGIEWVKSRLFDFETPVGRSGKRG